MGKCNRKYPNQEFSPPIDQLKTPINQLKTPIDQLKTPIDQLKTEHVVQPVDGCIKSGTTETCDGDTKEVSLISKKQVYDRAWEVVRAYSREESVRVALEQGVRVAMEQGMYKNCLYAIL